MGARISVNAKPFLTFLTIIIRICDILKAEHDRSQLPHTLMYLFLNRYIYTFKEGTFCDICEAKASEVFAT
jgi:hypothetical protein